MPAAAATARTAAPIPGELGRIAARFGLRPWDGTTAPELVAPLADAIQQADQLWTAPQAGEVQRGVVALFGGRPPASLVGVRLWPVLTQSASGPALTLADVRHRVHAVVDVAHVPLGSASSAPRPGWVAASGVALAARMSGSHELWRHWHPELSAHAPHDWSPACDDHAHLARANAQGQFVAGIPQHDAWVMCRSWLPRGLVVPSATDVRWIVLSASDRPLREREPLVRSRWEAVSFTEFAVALCGYYEADTGLPASIAAVLRTLLPAPRSDDAETATPATP